MRLYPGEKFKALVGEVFRLRQKLRDPIIMQDRAGKWLLEVANTYLAVDLDRWFVFGNGLSVRDPDLVQAGGLALHFSTWEGGRTREVTLLVGRPIELLSAHRRRCAQRPKDSEDG